MNNFIIIRQILFFLLRHRGGDNILRDHLQVFFLLVAGIRKLPRGFIDRGFVQLVATDIAEFNGASVILWRVKNAVPFR